MIYDKLLLRKSVLALTAVSIVVSCTPKEDAKLKERWDTQNSPLKIFASEQGFETKLANLPLSGQPDKMPWSDNYWPTYHGGITYRWLDSKSAELERALRQSSDRIYAGQLDDNESLQKLRSEVLGYSVYSKEKLEAMTPEERKKLIATLSPAEKLDIYRGAFDYPTVKAERARTNIENTLRKLPDADGNLTSNSKYVDKFKIPTWFGLCHAWAPATVLFNEPDEVTMTSKDGFEVRMAASDVKALLTYAVHSDRGGNSDLFMGKRCNTDFDADGIDPIIKLISEIKRGDMADVNAKVTELLNTQRLPAESLLAAASFFYGFAPSQLEAEAAFSALHDRLKSRSNGATVRNLAKVFKRSATNYADAGSTAEINFRRLQANLTEAIKISTPACTDTNAGAFHLVLANKVGLQKTSFVVDVTRDDEVWNQAVARYESKIVEEFTGDRISPDAAPGTVKEVRVRTKFIYTTEAAMDWKRVGDDKNLMDYHVTAGDRLSDGKRYYVYRLELDAGGNIIGGSWESSARPDFVWANEDFIFDSQFSDIEEIYYQSIGK
jgi:hypothetical protein